MEDPDRGTAESLAGSRAPRLLKDELRDGLDDLKVGACARDPDRGRDGLRLSTVHGEAGVAVLGVDAHDDLVGPLVDVRDVEGGIGGTWAGGGRGGPVAEMPAIRDGVRIVHHVRPDESNRDARWLDV